MPQVRTLYGTLLRRMAMLLALALGVHAASPVTLADAFADANKAAALPSGTTSADAKLFPLIAAMQRAPLSIRVSAASGAAVPMSYLDLAMLAAPGQDEWEELDAWASSEAQQAVLASITEVTNPKEKFRIGLPYGGEGVSEEWISAGLSVPLKSGDLLATAQWDYLYRMIEVAQLCAVESMRLADKGEGDKALEVLLGWMRFSRMLADRPSHHECALGLMLMQRAGERMRDIAYLYPKSFTEKGLREHLTQMANDMRERGLDRLVFPTFERFAVQQVIDETFTERGGIRPGEFASMMATITSVDQPLKFMAEAAYWRAVANSHAQWFDATEELERVFGDWGLRWGVERIGDPILLKSSHFERLDRRAHTVIGFLCEPLDSLMDVRDRARVEYEGTRAALGVVGFKIKQKTWPPTVNAVSPEWVRPPALDHYHIDSRRLGFEPFGYFVPIRDDKFGPREEPHPHQVTLVPGPVVLPEGDYPPRFALANMSTFIDGKGAPSLNRIPDARPELVNLPAPKWEAQEWTGPEVTQESTQGKPVLLVFWAPDSKPSLDNMPLVNMLHALYSPQGLVVLGISSGSAGEKSISDLATELSIKFPLGRDSNGQTVKSYKVDATPWYVLIGPSGDVVGSGVPADQLETAVNALMLKSGGGAGGQPQAGALANGLPSGMDLPAMLSGGDPSALAIFPFTVPDGASLIDPSGKFDLAKLRAAMKKSVIDNGEIMGGMVAGLAGQMSLGGDIDGRIANAASGEGAEAFAALGAGASSLGKLLQIAFNTPSFVELVRTTAAKYQEAIASPSGGEAPQVQGVDLAAAMKAVPDQAALRTALTDVANAYTAPENADLMNEIAAQYTAQTSAAAQAGAIATIAAAVPIIANIDDSEFILYSAGWDNETNRCRVVGYKGEDVLIYPAPITLRRQMLGIEPVRNN